jgi:hypothetical protein
MDDMGMPLLVPELELLEGGIGSTSNDVREAMQGRPVASYTFRALKAAMSSIVTKPS